MQLIGLGLRNVTLFFKNKSDGRSTEIEFLLLGNQPLLRPGEQFEYTSGAVLKTPHGSMHGTYRMVAEDGRQFEAEIAPFPLTQPGSVN